MWTLALGPDGRTLVSGGDDKTVVLWTWRASPTSASTPSTGPANGVSNDLTRDEWNHYVGPVHEYRDTRARQVIDERRLLTPAAYRASQAAPAR